MMPELTPLQKRGQQYADAINGVLPSPEPRGFSPDPRIGIALGGGSARGLTHIPYLEALDEMGLVPSVVAGTSIGAMIGAGWASGMSGLEIREHSFQVLGTMRLIASRLWSTHVRGLQQIFQSGIPVQLDALSVVESFVPNDFPQLFSGLKMPFYVVATDFQSWDQVTFSHGLLKPAIAASIAIPGLFKPVAFEGRVMVDGGVVNPLPLDQVAPDADILIGIDVNGDPSERMNKVSHKISEVWFGSAQIMMHSLIAHQLAAYPPDIYLRPHLPTLGVLEFWRVREIISHAEKEKDRFKRLVTAKVEAFIAGQQRTL